MTLAGGLVFWLVTLTTSMLPVAGEFRSTSSVPYADVLLESLPAGLLISFCVAYCLLSYGNRAPTRNCFSKSVILSFIAFIVIEPVVSLLHGGNELYYFLIGGALSVPRFLFLGLVVGYLYEKYVVSSKARIVRELGALPRKVTRLYSKIVLD
jgi:hypothetical protein